MREARRAAISRRKRRDQYTVSKNPMTMFRRTASSTLCSRARRRRNSSNLELNQKYVPVAKSDELTVNSWYH
jgi:hypothetical protein